MSYIKLNIEIVKYYKQNNMSFCYNQLVITKDEEELYLKKYNEVRDIILKKWFEEKKYNELISCAHEGLLDYEEFIKPLEIYFVKENLTSYLKILCERKIRFKIENTITILKDLKGYFPEVSKEEIISYDLNKNCDKNKCCLIEVVAKWRIKTLNALDSYISLLKKTSETDYLDIIENMRKHVFNLSIRKSHLKYIMNKK